MFLTLTFLLKDLDKRELIVTEVAETDYSNYTEKELVFDDLYIGRFNVLLLIPKQDKKAYPGVIGLHGHGAYNRVFKDEYLGEELAQQGYVVIIPTFNAITRGKLDNNISKVLYSQGFTLMGLQVYETFLALKYLKYLDFVNNRRIGVLSHSGGSSQANLVVRLTKDINAQVSDMTSNYFDFLNNRGISESMHCETLPKLSYYYDLINDKETLNTPNLQVSYEYPSDEERQRIVNFLNEHLKN